MATSDFWAKDVLKSIIDKVQQNYESYIDDAMGYVDWRLPQFTKPVGDFPSAPSTNGDTVNLSKDKIFDPLSMGDWPVYRNPELPDWSTLYPSGIPHDHRLWQSAEMDTLIAVVQKMLSGSIAWLSDDYQQKVFDRDRERRRQALADGLRLLNSRHAARGFKLPNSMLTAQESELTQKYYFDNANESRELAKLVEEAARDYQKFGVQQELSYEQLNQNFTNAYDKLIFDLAAERVKSYLAQVEAEARRFEAEVRGVIARMEAERAAWAATLDYNKMQMDVALFPLRQYEIQVKAAAEKYRGQVDVYKIEVETDMKSLESAMKQTSELLKSVSSNDINLTKRTATGA